MEQSPFQDPNGQGGNLSKLPNELQNEIASYLTSFQDIARFRQVSKWARNILPIEQVALTVWQLIRDYDQCLKKPTEQGSNWKERNINQSNKTKMMCELLRKIHNHLTNTETKAIITQQSPTVYGAMRSYYNSQVQRLKVLSGMFPEASLLINGLSLID